MIATGPMTRRLPPLALLWALILIGLPALVASLPPMAAPIAPRAAAPVRPPAPPPPVEPVRILALSPVAARAINAAMPFSTLPNPAARPFTFAGDAASRDRAIDCLAAAQLYEAGDDPGGQRAVAQVVINRLRHPAFPKTVCGVVFQGSERATGCQFTFTCDGALGRSPSEAAWARARAVARAMLSGGVYRPIGLSTHYHTDWVVPYWSATLDKVAAVGTHLFFRWKGWWGTPGAFRGRPEGPEPAIVQLAFLSPGHAGAEPTLAGARALPPIDPAREGPAMAVGRERIGTPLGAGRLAAIDSSGDAFVLILDKGADPARYEATALDLCRGRTRCRVLGWTQEALAPRAFPIAESALASMSYAYMRLAGPGLQRSLYNCQEFRDRPASRCMRERAPSETTTLSPAILSPAP
jgi:spore germination cell wall hydrolase CwlJ-like protein